MTRTRPSGLPVVPDELAIVTEEITHIDGRGRINLLPRWTDRVGWLRKRAAGTVEALMVFLEPGLISIQDWKEHGPRIQQRYQELAGESDPEAFQALRLIQDRYQRLLIPKRDRPSLGDAALAHLGLQIERGRKAIVYVAVFPHAIELLAPAYRNATLLTGDPGLDDLP